MKECLLAFASLTTEEGREDRKYDLYDPNVCLFQNTHAFYNKVNKEREREKKKEIYDIKGYRLNRITSHDKREQKKDE